MLPNIIVDRWSNITALCGVAGGGLVEWLFDLGNKNIGRGLALKVGTWSKSGVVSYDI